uniref:Uncharacterized protein n=1 Tax=Opuntia streptacantha TaxID=393608 RepID=A0A7C9A051_OPUST
MRIISFYFRSMQSTLRIFCCFNFTNHVIWHCSLLCQRRFKENRLLRIVDTSYTLVQVITSFAENMAFIYLNGISTIIQLHVFCIASQNRSICFSRSLFRC